MARYLRLRSDVPPACDVLRRGLGGTQLRKLRAWDLDRFYDQMLRGGGRQGRPLAPATVRRVHTVLRLALEQAVRGSGWRRIPPCIPPRRPFPGAPRADLRRAGPPARRISGSRGPGVAAYLRLAAALGARRGEVCALRWPAVNLDKGTVAFQRALVLGVPKMATWSDNKCWPQREG